MKKEYVSTKITRLLKEKDWTLYRLSKESGVQTTNLKKICFHNRIPTIPTIIKICNGFGITLSEFFDEGNTMINQLIVSEQQLLNYYHNMAIEDKLRAADYMHRLSKHVPATEGHAQKYENADNHISDCADQAAANMVADN